MGGKYVQSTAACASSTLSTVGTTMTAAPMSVACWISRSSAYATRAPGAAGPGQVRHSRATCSHEVASCCISTHMKS